VLAGSAFVILAVLFVFLIVGIAVFAYQQAKKRREEMAAYALSRGWRYEAEQPLLVDRFQGAPFGLGHGRSAGNAVYGQHDGREFVSFDYQYKTTEGSGKERHTVTHTFSVLALSMGVSLPTLTVDPENFLERFVGRLTNSDIDLELEDFNRAFTVTCADRKFASDVLHPRMMEFLLQHRDVGWRFERDSMLMVAAGRRSVQQIDATLALMDQISDQIPEFVWKQVKGQGGSA
jgi:cbb3-type cytochrome oxidase subunit 3